LDNMDSLGRPTKMQLLRDGKEIADTAQIHDDKLLGYQRPKSSKPRGFRSITEQRHRLHFGPHSMMLITQRHHITVTHLVRIQRKPAARAC
jgi:hypothetical protein